MSLIMQTVETQEGKTLNVIVKCLWLHGSRSTNSSLNCKWEVNVFNNRIKTDHLKVRREALWFYSNYYRVNFPSVSVAHFKTV